MLATALATAPMSDWKTSTRLLHDLTDADPAAWEAFSGRFRAVLARRARRRGLSAEAAEDVCQEVLSALFAGLRAGRFQAQRGSLRAFLFGIAARQINRAAARGTAGARTTVWAALSDPTPRPDPVEQAERAERLARCLRQVESEIHASTWQAFAMTALEARDIRESAAALGLTQNAVCIARHRVLKRLRELWAGQA